MRKERNGLYLCEVPTGIGKSYQAAHTMEEYVKEIREEYAKNTKYEREENIGDIVALCDFDEQPTAYDVDKVIEQIEYRRANFDCKLCKYNDDEKTICSEDCSDALIDGLIEIVKGGGVE